MTSSLIASGRHRPRALFRSEAVLRSRQSDAGGSQSSPETPAQLQTHWVLLREPSLPGYRTPPPPERPSDYVGQVIAVPAEPEPLEPS